MSNSVFVTPASAHPKKVLKTFRDGSSTVVEQARYVAYMGSNTPDTTPADQMAEKIGLHKSFRLDNGIWILSRNKRKKAIRLGAEKLPLPEKEALTEFSLDDFFKDPEITNESDNENES